MDKVKKVIDKMSLKVTKIDSVPESYSSEVAILTLDSGDKVVLKIPYSKQKLLREKEILKLLDRNLPVPKILDHWEGNEEVTGALLLSYIDGVPITGKIDIELSYKMGELLAKLHKTPMDSYGLVENEKNDWWSGVSIRFNEWIKECEGILEDKLIKRCIDKFNDLYKRLPKADGPCLVHFDFRRGNILINDSEIKGLIDFESSRGGSSDVDFTKIKLYVWDRYKGTKEAFIKGYESIRRLPDLDNTLPFYLFFNAVGGIAWCIRRKELEGEFFTENMNQLTDILDNNIKI